MIDYLYLFLYKSFSFLVKNSSEKTLDFIVDKLSKFAFYASKKRRKVIYANLSLCFKDMSIKEKKDIAIYSYKNLLYNIVIFLKNDNKDILKNMKYENTKEVEDAIKNGKKIIFFTAHFGMWELLSAAIIKKFQIPFSVVGRELDSVPMQKYLRNSREKMGVELIDKRGALKGMIKALNNGRALGLLVDQSLYHSKGGVDVIFFDKKVTQTSAASILAHKFDALLVPIFIRSENFKNQILFTLKPISIDKNIPKKEDIKRLNQLQATTIESIIKLYPYEWFYSHKRFKVYDSEIYK